MGEVTTSSLYLYRMRMIEKMNFYGSQFQIVMTIAKKINQMFLPR